jgi:TrpR-related protein YerC/YecD
MTRSKQTYSKTTNLYQAFLLLENLEEANAFCLDLMTPKEIEEFADRFEVAAQLNQGKTQRQVAADTKVSIATVTRVNRFLQRGHDGYKTALNKLHHLSSSALASTS